MNTQHKHENKLFKEYDKSELSQIKTIKNSSLLTIAKGYLEKIEVLLLTLKSFELKPFQIQSIFSNFKFLKMKSKYILNKLGYTIDAVNKTLTMIYENKKGKIFEFSDFDKITEEDKKKSQTQPEIKKVFLIEKIFNIMNRLKTGYINLGYLDPSIFLFNNFSENPLLLIDYSFLFIYGNIKDPNIKLLFGIFDSQDTKSNDIAMALIFLTKIFLTCNCEDQENEHSEHFPYQLLIYKFYAEFFCITKPNKITFSDIVENHIKNKNVKEFIQKNISENFAVKSKKILIDRNSETLAETDKISFNNFYKDFYDNVFLQESKTSNCVMCNNQSEFINSTCYEPLCLKCKEDGTHQCKETNLYQIEVLKINAEKNLQKIQKLNQKLDCANKFKLFNFHSDVMCRQIIPKFSEIYEKHKQVTSTVIKEQGYLSDLLTLFSQTFTKSIRSRANGILLTLNDYLKDKINEGDIEEDIMLLLEVSVHDAQLKFAQIEKIVNFSNVFSKIINYAENYAKQLCYYRTYILQPKYENAYGQIFEKIERKPKSLNLEEIAVYNNLPYFLGGFYKSDNQIINPIHYPIIETNKLKIFKVTEENIDSELSPIEVDVSFENISKINYFPRNCRWVSFNKFLFFSGGINEEEKSLNNLFVLNCSKIFSCENRREMQFERHSHAMCTFNDFFIIVVGGRKNKTCEIYSILKDNWFRLPDLTCDRSNSAVIVVNEGILYSFAGEYFNNETKEFRFLKNIEFLDLVVSIELNDIDHTNAYLLNKWKTVELDDSESSLLAISIPGLVRFKNNSVILLGGCNTVITSVEGLSEYAEYSDKILEFNLKGFKKLELLSAGSGLKKGFAFRENNFFNFNGNFIQVGNYSHDKEMLVKYGAMSP